MNGIEYQAIEAISPQESIRAIDNKLDGIKDDPTYTSKVKRMEFCSDQLIRAIHEGGEASEKEKGQDESYMRAVAKADLAGNKKREHHVLDIADICTDADVCLPMDTTLPSAPTRGLPHRPNPAVSSPPPGRKP